VLLAEHEDVEWLGQIMESGNDLLAGRPGKSAARRPQ
jgi:hypothetical protein